TRPPLDPALRPSRAGWQARGRARPARRRRAAWPGPAQTRALRFAERVLRNIGSGLSRQFDLMLAPRITFPHLSVSSAMSLAKSAGEPASVVAPRSTNRALIFRSTRAALISLLSTSTISGGVFLGAPMPTQVLVL